MFSLYICSRSQIPTLQVWFSSDTSQGPEEIQNKLLANCGVTSLWLAGSCKLLSSSGKAFFVGLIFAEFTFGDLRHVIR